MVNSDSAPKSLADLVFDPKHYSKLLASSAKDGQSSPQPKPTVQASNTPQPSRQTTPGNPPPVSISDLILNGVTYDAILASSVKKLSVESPIADATSPMNSNFPPPNTPIDASHSVHRSMEQVVEEAMCPN
ncbi:hypothetical protein CCMSSC00406_0009829 [Pleurotus cornucopiae]|uniref:Uncharacterized protein n=1 Tax=Pleurotus cornucopiae TaxID=5321 RepID=A0ACB7ITU1_PLECO|nr:hypothetical protein CCMSSC00406_0009829 [Pleurotus cornucopiae]